MAIPSYDPRTTPRGILRSNRTLNGDGSHKDTRHIVLGLPPGMTYEPGDSLGVHPQNDPRLVDHLLELTACEPDTIVPTPTGDSMPAIEALSRYYQIAHVPLPVLKQVARESEAQGLLELCQPERKADLKDYLEGMDLIDLFHEHPDARMKLPRLLPLLRPLQPRLYSIAGSQRTHPDEAHLCVGLVRYDAHHRPHTGVASGYLCQRTQTGDEVACFVHANPAFQVPEDPARDIIMIGPGTGIAPFRAFIEERIATGATGRNWLFFGDQHEATDWLYREECTTWLQQGVLDRVSLAWSRDQEEKIYVQHRIREHADAIWEWMEGGAVVYVCGDAKRMAKDVDSSLKDLIKGHAGVDDEGAKQYLKASINDGRYQRDVYAI